MSTEEPHTAATRHEYRVRYEQPGANGSPVVMEVRGTVDLVAETISFDLPANTVDVVQARALLSILFEGIYGSLRPGGPQLVLEKNTGDGWPDELPAT